MNTRRWLIAGGASEDVGPALNHSLLFAGTNYLSPNRQEMLTLCWLNVGPASQRMDQHYTTIASTYRIYQAARLTPIMHADSSTRVGLVLSHIQSALDLYLQCPQNCSFLSSRPSCYIDLSLSLTENKPVLDNCDSVHMHGA